MKKLFLTFALLFTASAAIACNAATAVLALDDDDIYALEAIGATELLKQTLALGPTAVAAPRPAESGLVLLADTTAGATTTTTENPDPATTEPSTTVGPIVGSDLETVNKYLNMIESYLGGNNGLSVTSVASDRVGYEFKIIYVFNDLLGADKTIIIYYNISGSGELPDDGTLTTTEGTTTAAPETTTAPATTTMPETTTAPETTTITPDTTAGATPLALPLSGAAGTDDVKVLSTIVGIIVYGDVEYFFEGEKVVEGAEEIFRMRAAVDNANFVRVTYKLDDDGEQKFFHEIVVNGVVVELSKTKVEIGVNGIEASLEFIQGAASGKYDFEIVTAGAVTEIRVRYETVSAEGVAEHGEIRITATVDAFSGATTYEYVIYPEGSSESYYEGNRDDHEHGADDELDDVETDDIDDGDVNDDEDDDDIEDDEDDDDIEDDEDDDDLEDDETDETEDDEHDEVEDDEHDEHDDVEDDEEDEADDTVASADTGAFRNL